MIINYPSSSAYAATPQASWFIGSFKNRPITPDGGDRPFTVDQKYHNRPDLLAFDLYGKSGLWWVFCMRNPNILRDPIWDLTVGTIIVIPSRRHVEATYG